MAALKMKPGKWNFKKWQCCKYNLPFILRRSLVLFWSWIVCWWSWPDLWDVVLALFGQDFRIFCSSENYYYYSLLWFICYNMYVCLRFPVKKKEREIQHPVINLCESLIVFSVTALLAVFILPAVLKPDMIFRCVSYLSLIWTS